MDIKVLDRPVDGQYKIALQRQASCVIGCTPSDLAICSASIENDGWLLVVDVMSLPAHPPPRKVTVLLFTG
jgi:hypothetical protein